MILDPIQLKPLPADFKLRDEQKTAFDLVRQSIGKGNRRIVLHMSTAVGKTVWAGMVFYLSFQKNPTCQCLFIVNRNTLLLQAKEEFEQFFGFDCGIVQGNQPLRLDKHVQIATIQTLQNRLTSDNPSIWREFNNLPVAISVIDECHLMFKGYQTVLEAWNPIMLGLTGTPFTKGMGRFWEDMVRPSSMADAIKNGTLCDYRVKVCVSVNRRKLKTVSTGEYMDSDVEDEVGKIIGDVYKEWATSEDMQGRPFIGFAKSIKTCIALTKTFTDNGARVAYVHSKMSDDDVQAVLDSFKAGMYEGVFSVIKLIEGFNFPESSAMISCTPLAPSKHDPNIPNSCNRFVQMAGRVLRQHESKGYALIHDHTGNFLQYGAYEDIENHFQVLDDGKPKEVKMSPEERKAHAVRECPKCHMAMKGKICTCGHETKKPTQFLEAGDLEFIDGEMVEIKRAPKNAQKQRKKEMDWPAKIKVYGQFKQYCLDKGKKSGYAAHCWKSFIGTWPNDKRLKDAPLVPVGENVRMWIQSRNIAYAKKQGKQG